MEERRNDDYPAHEHGFPNEEGNQVPTLWPWNPMIRSNAAANHFLEVIEELPLDHYDPVQGPEIKVLPAMHPASRLMRCQAAYHPIIYVGVVTVDVGVGVMENRVLPMPQIGTGSNQIHGH